MRQLEVALTLVGLGLLIGFLWKLRRHLKSYPFLLMYVLPMAVRVAYSSYVNSTGTMGSAAYAEAFWTTQCIMAGFRLSVTWEVLRQAVPRSHPLRPVACGLSLAVLTFLAFLFWLLGPEGSIYSDLERKLSLTCGVWTAVVLGLTTFYGIRLRREVFAIALGLGLFVTVSLVNSSAIVLIPSFERVWAPISQSSFSMIMAIWLWGFWNPPQDRRPPVANLPDEALSAWQRRWSELRQSTRRVLSRQ